MTELREQIADLRTKFKAWLEEHPDRRSEPDVDFVDSETTIADSACATGDEKTAAACYKRAKAEADKLGV